MKVRLGIGRMSYSVTPGLYALGKPGSSSPVLASANYKLSFDRLRQELTGLDLWILVLDTRGINVWCAAGKGSFGTSELVERIEKAGLTDRLDHNRLIIPQLGAPGVAGHEVKRRAGFKVVFGPVRARDIPAFLEADCQATPEMRRVRFRLFDRIATIPVEIVLWGKYFLLILALFLGLSGLGVGGYDLATTATDGVRAVLFLCLAFLTGTILVPVLLPWVPGRAFSVKGALLGLVMIGASSAPVWLDGGAGWGVLETVSWFFLVPAISAFLAMNYTGCTTFASRSGVRREMRMALPIQIVAGLVGLGLWTTSRFLT